MGKAEIRAKAEHTLRETDMKGLSNQNRAYIIEAALTATYDQGWDSAMECAENIINVAPIDEWDDLDRQVIADEIRHLKKGQGV